MAIQHFNTEMASIDGDLLEQLLIAIANDEFPYPNGGFISGNFDDYYYDDELTDDDIDYFDWYQQNHFD